MRPEQPFRASPAKREDPEESSWDEGAVGLSGTITALTEGRLKVKPKPFQFGFHAPGVTNTCTGTTAAGVRCTRPGPRCWQHL